MSESRTAPESPVSVPVPAYMSAEDGDYQWYVAGHDRDELWSIDDPDDLESEPVYMRPIRASQAEDYGFSLDDGETLTRNRETGRFEPRWFWIECHEKDTDAHPFMGVRYKPDALSTESALQRTTPESPPPVPEPQP